MQSVKAVCEGVNRLFICFSNIVCILPVLDYIPSSRRINILNFHLIFILMNLPRTISNVIIDLITEKKSKKISFAHSHIDKTIKKKTFWVAYSVWMLLADTCPTEKKILQCHHY